MIPKLLGAYYSHRKLRNMPGTIFGELYDAGVIDALAFHTRVSLLLGKYLYVKDTSNLNALHVSLTIQMTLTMIYSTTITETVRV